LAELGVAKKVATPEPKPEMPVDTGKPVALVKVALTGVPSAEALPLASKLTERSAG
jgi:hypothetical protein